MGEVTIRLNRSGLEQGRMWQAVLAAVAILLPMAIWAGTERLIGSTTQALDPDEAISLQSFPVDSASLEFHVPGEGWTTGVGLSAQQRALSNGRTSATVEVDANVDSLRTLLDRRSDRLTSSQVGLAATNVREYENEESGLEGYRADLYGRDSAGSIVVVGNGKGAAASLIVLAPSDKLKAATAGADDFVASFKLEGE
ncbi:hypothetical protein [Glycomyces buryatensis]|uniref:Uncharacterized protein n=1 Tax=Glycomyces buryatensis TaxID=2570927 RepID=A0A4S8Q368_9ACTN|nr:hypothetical protein [Glycomyces buryatensis]THV38558.1 hypothetical protein FAB82_19145 [Glycomyces buryatensis]